MYGHYRYYDPIRRAIFCQREVILNNYSQLFSETITVKFESHPFQTDRGTFRQIGERAYCAGKDQAPLSTALYEHKAGVCTEDCV